jgi:hypothetical protein
MVPGSFLRDRLHFASRSSFRADPRLYLSQAAIDEQLDAVGTSLAKERLETDINGYLLAQRAD